MDPVRPAVHRIPRRRRREIECNKLNCFLTAGISRPNFDPGRGTPATERGHRGASGTAVARSVAEMRRNLQMLVPIDGEGREGTPERGGKERQMKSLLDAGLEWIGWEGKVNASRRRPSPGC